MNLVFIQRLDRLGGGSRSSLKASLQALHAHRPHWGLTLVSQEVGPLGRQAFDWGVSHHVADLPRFRKPWERVAYWNSCRFIKNSLIPFKPTAIVSNEWVTAPHALAIAKHLKIPAISYVRDFAALERGKKYHLHRMDQIICVCESLRQALIAQGYDPQKTRTIYNPIIRPAVSKPQPEALSRIRETTQVDHWLLYLGRISPRKNQVEAIKTLEHLRRISGQRWGLILAGDADPDYAAEVKSAATTAGLQQEVLLLGQIDHPAWLVEIAAASILTSTSEGLARALIESILCDLPAFSYPIPGLEDIYGDHKDLFVAHHRDPSVFAELIFKRLQEPATFRKAMPQLKSHLEKRHSLAHHIESLEKTLLACIAPS